MLKIGTGRAHNQGTKFWRIVVVGAGQPTEFNHNHFPHILDQTPVYFIDLDLDPRFCENVQSVFEVDGFVGQATPVSGSIAADAEWTLRLYVMAALLTALGKQGEARTNYRGLLGAKMQAVAAAGLAEPQGQVTLALLISLGIAA